MAMMELTEPLTERELAILQRIADGQSSARIARELQLSPNTVLWYRKRLHLKFDVHTVVALVNAAREQGII